MRRKYLETIIKAAEGLADTALVTVAGLEGENRYFNIPPEYANVVLNELERTAKENNEYIDVVIIFNNGERIHEEADFRNFDEI
jgi:hypothetical protein